MKDQQEIYLLRKQVNRLVLIVSMSSFHLYHSSNLQMHLLLLLQVSEMVWPISCLGTAALLQRKVSSLILKSRGEKKKVSLSFLRIFLQAKRLNQSKTNPKPKELSLFSRLSTSGREMQRHSWKATALNKKLKNGKALNRKFSFLNLLVTATSKRLVRLKKDSSQLKYLGSDREKKSKTILKMKKKTWTDNQKPKLKTKNSWHQGLP